MSNMDAEGSMTRSEEELTVDTVQREAGRVRLRKHVDTEHVEQTFDRSVEEVDVERTPALDDDDGEVITYDDGSISVPVYEEELVVEKRLFVKERVVVRKRTVTEPEQVEADLRRERVEVEADPAISDHVTFAGDDGPQDSAT